MQHEVKSTFKHVLIITQSKDNNNNTILNTKYIKKLPNYVTYIYSKNYCNPRWMI